MSHLLYLLVLAAIPLARVTETPDERAGMFAMVAFFVLVAVRIRRIRHLSRVTRKSTAAFR